MGSGIIQTISVYENGNDDVLLYSHTLEMGHSANERISISIVFQTR